MMAEFIWDSSINAGTLLHLGGVVVLVAGIYWRMDKRISIIENSIIRTQKDMEEMKESLSKVNEMSNEMAVAQARLNTIITESLRRNK